jgi:hypothetical protein
MHGLDRNSIVPYGTNVVHNYRNFYDLRFCNEKLGVTEQFNLSVCFSDFGIALILYRVDA